VIGTLPPVGTPAPPVVTVAITEPEAPPETTVPEETVASTAPAPTAAPQPVTTKRAAKPATTAPKKPPTPPSASTSAPRTASSFGVQAGAFTDPNGAKTGLATITAAGFSGFRIVGTGPYKVVRTGMTEADARALAARIRAAGYQSFVLT
jgi:cell division septation protein DedD